MKIRLRQLIEVYKDMLAKERSRIRADMLRNVIDDLEKILEEAQ